VDQFSADLVSICAHKFHGPKGAGALFIKSALLPDPILFGGAHENERRAGTENLAGILGFVAALELFVPHPVFERAKLEPLCQRLLTAIGSLNGVQVVGSRNACLCNTLSFLVEGSDSISLLAGLDLEGICASSGSACSAGSLEPSHVVEALGFEKSLAKSLIRFSLGRETTEAEIAVVESVLPLIVKRAQRYQ
jgi:cysteine desulfurase